MNREDQVGLDSVWDDLAVLIKSQPIELRRRFYRGIRTIVHDLIDTMGKVYSAESLLRFKMKDNPEYKELLEIMRNSSLQSVELIKDFALHFDNPDNSDE